MPELRGELRVESGRSSFLLAKIPAWCWVKLPGRFLLELQAQGLFPGQAGRGQGQGGAVAPLPGAENVRDRIVESFRWEKISKIILE